jgi:hypothetical protein
VTRSQLRGPRYQRLFHGICCRTTPDPAIDLATWSRAAALLIGDRGALAGYSAAELSPGPDRGRGGLTAGGAPSVEMTGMEIFQPENRRLGHLDGGEVSRRC